MSKKCFLEEKVPKIIEAYPFFDRSWEGSSMSRASVACIRPWVKSPGFKSLKPNHSQHSVRAYTAVGRILTTLHL